MSISEVMGRNVHTARFPVKAKRTPIIVHNARMSDETIPDAAKRLVQARKNRGFATARAASDYFGWKYDGYIQHERGLRGLTKVAARYARAFHVSESWLLTGEGAGGSKIVPIMGYVGAGAEVLPEFEQIPPDGLEDIELPFAVPDDLIGLQIRGDSMLPRYDDGDVILVHREQRNPTDAFLGEEAAVRTDQGKRFLKRVIRGYDKGRYNLESWNAKPIEGVVIEWVGEIYLTVRSGQIRRIERSQHQIAVRRMQRRTRAGTPELDFEG